MNLRASLKKIGWSTLLGVSVGAAAQTIPRPVQAPNPTLQREFMATIGYDAKRPLQAGGGILDTAALTRLSFGSRNMENLGFRYDPRMVRHIPVNIDASFDEPVQNVHGGSNSQIGIINSPVLDLLADDYLQREKEVFGAYSIQGGLTQPTDLPGLTLDASAMGHEARHVTLADRVNLTQLLSSDPQDRSPQDLDHIVNSKLIGFGPVMERIFTSEESPEQTQARHRRLAALLQPDHGSEDMLKEYPLLYTELRSFLMQNILDPFLAGERDSLPQDRKQLWAAVCGAAGGPMPDAHADNPVSSYLASEEGKESLQKFAYSGDAWLRDSMSHIQLKAAIDQLSERQKTAFFEEALPLVYADAMQEEGFVDTREKMGLQPMPDYGIVFGSQLVHDDADSPAPWKAEDWKQMGALVEPKYRLRLEELAIQHRNPVALQALLQGAAQPPSDQEQALLEQLSLRVSRRSETGAEKKAALQNVVLLRSSPPVGSLIVTTELPSPALLQK